MLLSAPALGALVALLALLTTGHMRRQGRVVISCVFAYAIGLALLAVSQVFVVSFAILAVLGFLDGYSTVTRHSVVQMAAPPRMRGRVMANMGVITRGTGPLSEAQSGVLAGAIGPPATLLAGTMVLMLAALGTARFNRILWSFSRDGTSPATDDI